MKNNRTLIALLVFIGFTFLVTVPVIVLALVHSVQHFVDEGFHGPAVTSLPNPEGTTYRLVDLGRMGVTWPYFGVANSNDDHVEAFTPDSSGSTSTMEVWNAKKNKARFHTFDFGDLLLLSTNIRRESVIQGDNGLYIWGPFDPGEPFVLTNLQGLDGSTDTVNVENLTDGGYVIGASETGKKVFRACEWTAKSAKAIPIATHLPDSYTYQIACGTNGRTDLALWAMKQSGKSYAGDVYFQHNDRDIRVESLPDFPNMLPNQINVHNEIVGGMFVKLTELASDPDMDRAFLWRDGKTIDLGSLGRKYAEAMSINSSSQVVGMAYDRPLDMDPNHYNPETYVRPIPRAFLWQNGKMIDLNSLVPAGTPWVLQVATQINDHGQIVGIGSYEGEDNHVFVLTPTK